MKDEKIIEHSRLCDKLNVSVEKVSAVFDMLHQFQKNEVPIASIDGSAFIADGVWEELKDIASQFGNIHIELRD